MGYIYGAESHAGIHWPDTATPTKLLNPNSKVFVFSVAPTLYQVRVAARSWGDSWACDHFADACAGAQVVAYNPSKTARNPLALAVSYDGVASVRSTSSNGGKPLRVALARADAADMSYAVRGGGSQNWSQFVTLDSSTMCPQCGEFEYPTSTRVGHSVYTTYSASTHVGIRLAITVLPPPT